MAFVTVKEIDSIKTEEGYLTKVQVEISDPNTGDPIPEWVKTQPGYDPNNFPLG
jgi:hypothetical protein